MHCRTCLNPNAVPSQRRWYEQFLRLLFLRPYRGHVCNDRFYRLTVP